MSLRYISQIPYEAKPRNKFNPVKSAFNFKPVPTPGLVFNPPASLPSVKQTPRAFLPPNDPRRNLPIHKTYTDEELADMPIIHGTTKKYDVTEETAKEIINLRVSDPQTWTISKLCKKFNVRALFVIALTKDLNTTKTTPKRLTDPQKEQLKRVKMWLRNEY